MSAPSKTAQSGLTAYESEQVRQIAAWKSEPPNPFGEMFKRMTLPGARVVERLIPDQVVRTAIEKAYDVAELSAGQDEVKRHVNIQNLDEMRGKPLEECDRLANRLTTRAEVLSLAEGAATGAGGPLTTLIDIPLLFVLSLRTILKIGHCYGYRLDQPRDRPYVLGVLLIATSHSLTTRRERLASLREIEDWLLEETQQDIVGEEIASFLFQLEVFEDVPGVGPLSGALLNLAFIRRVGISACRVFQERWLHDNGKVDEIEPVEAPAHVLKTGWSGALARATYAGGYCLGFGVSLPVWFVASLFPPTDNALTRGVRDGAATASLDVDRTLGWTRAGEPALAPA